MRDTFSRLNPSPEFRELEEQYRAVHRSGFRSIGLSSAETFDGSSLFPHIEEIGRLIEATGSKTVLDFGSGKGLAYTERYPVLASGARPADIKSYWVVDSIACYDPGVPEFSIYPDRSFDALISTDVLEHIPERDVNWVLRSFFELASKAVFANIASYPAQKTLPNGWNAHVTIKPPEWWRERIERAAVGWSGRYVFKVLEHGSGRNLPVWLRRVTGGKKWRETIIAN